MTTPASILSLPLCRTCRIRRAMYERLCSHCRARLDRQPTKRIRSRHELHPPEFYLSPAGIAHAKRIAHYTALAALGLPLFGESEDES